MVAQEQVAQTLLSPVSLFIIFPVFRRRLIDYITNIGPNF